MTEKSALSSTMRIDLTVDEDASAVGQRQTGPSDEPPGASCRLIGGPDFRELLSHVYDAALITDLEGSVVSANERAVTFLNCDFDVMLGVNVVDVISGASRELLGTIRQNLQDERFVLIQAVCLQIGGGGFPAEISVNVLHLSDAEYLCFFIRDITLRREQEQRLRSGFNALHNAGSGVGVCDMEGHITYCNPALTSLLGCEDGADPTGTNLWEYLDEPADAEPIVRSVSSQDVWAGELCLRRWDGRNITVQASVAPNVTGGEGDPGELKGMVFSLIDTTLQKAAMAEVMRHHEKIEEDLNLAREFQQALMRRSYPVFPKGVRPEDSVLQFAHVYRPCGAVGGDSFEFLRFSDTKAGIIVYDVMGHGVRSALIVATVHGLIQEIRAKSEDPGSFLAMLNQDLALTFRESGQDAFVTALYLVVDTEARVVRVASAGHPRPVHARREAGSVEKVQLRKGVRGPALGLFPDISYETDERPFCEGDVLVLYTDGVGEARNDYGGNFESLGVETALRRRVSLPLVAMLEGVLEDAAAFCGSASFSDDVCLCAVEFVDRR